MNSFQWVLTHVKLELKKRFYLHATTNCQLVKQNATLWINKNRSNGILPIVPINSSERALQKKSVAMLLLLLLLFCECPSALLIFKNDLVDLESGKYVWRSSNSSSSRWLVVYVDNCYWLTNLLRRHANNVDVEHEFWIVHTSFLYSSRGVVKATGETVDVEY